MMTIKTIVLLHLCAFVSSFVLPECNPKIAPRSKNDESCVARWETKKDLEELARKLNPSIRFYDPLNLVEANLWGAGEEATIGFLRHAEIKHGRIAMFAFVGYLVHANQIQFPLIRLPENNASLSPPDLWDSLPDIAKLQILAFIGLLELWGEQWGSPDHYLLGGKPGVYPDFTSPYLILNLYDPWSLIRTKQSKAEKERGLLVELNNGRLAMIGIIGFLSAQTIPGSVPLLNGVLPQYNGEVMAPFTSDNIVMTLFGME